MKLLRPVRYRCDEEGCDFDILAETEEVMEIAVKLAMLHRRSPVIGMLGCDVVRSAFWTHNVSTIHEKWPKVSPLENPLEWYRQQALGP